ncbi:MAG: hypothetical protein E7053_09480 [Lentisphaerae bacterium]|nr:hypothetical protein [Lentisphaerota bacterium]
MKEERTFATTPFLICFAVALGVSYALPAAGSEMGRVHESAIARMYADQDAEAARCRTLVTEARALVIQGKSADACAKYEEAIKNLKENVIDQLLEEASRIDSWRSRQRLEEFTAELNNYKLEYGNLKLKLAEDALRANQFDTAIALATDAIVASETLRERAMQLQVTARGRKSAATRRDTTSAEVSDPGLPEREAQIRLLLTHARNYFREGLYDKAWEKVEAVYVIDPYNADASYLASQIYERFYEAGIRRRTADIQAQMAYEAWQWVEPAFPIRRDPGEDNTPGDDAGAAENPGDYAIQHKLDSIIFPVVDFNKTDLEAVVQFLRNNKSMDPDKVGVDISFMMPDRRREQGAEGEGTPGADPAAGEGGAEGEGGEEDYSDEDYSDEDYSDDGAEGEGESSGQSQSGIFVTLQLRNVTLRQVLDYICFLTDLTYVVRENGVIFGVPDQSMFSTEYTIFNNVKLMIVDGAVGGGSADSGSGDDYAGGDEYAGGEDFDADGDDDVPAGDEYDEGGEEGDSASAAPTGASRAVADNELTEAKLKAFFSIYGIEFPEGSSIGYSRGKLTMNNTAKNHNAMLDILARINVEAPMIEIEVKAIELSENDMEELGFNWALSAVSNRTASSQWSLGKGSNTKEGGALRMLDSMLSGGTSLISGLNIFPDLFGSFKPFGIDQTFNLTLTINALDQSDRTEQISAPRILVANGHRATIRMVKSYFFPDDWEEAEYELDEAGDNGQPIVTSTPPSPEFADDPTPIGTTLVVTPEILEGNRAIKLILNPRITSYTGNDQYEMVVRVWDQDTDENGRLEQYYVWRPVIATREISTTVVVNHGETLVIGGLSNSISKRRVDKIPILADIPFIGRLFQSQSENSTRRNMLIFVTARLVGNDGVPLPMAGNADAGGIPGIVR